MFNIGGGEFLVIALIALIVLGPQRLPEAARTAGRAMAELRRLSSGFQSELHNAMSEVEATNKRPPSPLTPAAPVADTASAKRVAPAIAAVSGQARPRRVPLQAAPLEPPRRNGTATKKASTPGTTKAETATRTSTTKTPSSSTRAARPSRATPGASGQRAKT